MCGRLMLLCLVAAVSAQPPVEWRVEAPPELAAVQARITSVDTAPMAASLHRAGLALPPRVHLELVARADAAAVPSWVVGSAMGLDRIVIYPDRIGEYPYGTLEAVVLHELGHLALAARAGDRPLPRWFHEGVAVSVESGWGPGSQLRLLLAAQTDPGIDDVQALFASAQLPATTTAYLLSAALVDHVRQQHGSDAPGRIAARVAAGVDFDRAFLLETGETPAHAAASAWRMYRGLRWLPVVTGPSAVWGLILALAVAAFAVRRYRRTQRRRRWAVEDAEEEAFNAEALTEAPGETRRDHQD